MSCKRNEPTPEIPTTIFQPGDQMNGWLKGKKNGLKFEASAHIQNHLDTASFFIIQFTTFSEEGFLRENIAFNKIPYRQQEYEVKGTVNLTYDGYVGTVYYRVNGDGHSSDGKYLMDESTQNTLTITEIDTVQNIVRGTFDVSYIRVEPDESDVYPLNIHFSEGEFEVAF